MTVETIQRIIDAVVIRVFRELTCVDKSEIERALAAAYPFGSNDTPELRKLWEKAIAAHFSTHEIKKSVTRRPDGVFQRSTTA